MSLSKTRILFFDIETMANKIYAWGKWEVNAIAYDSHWYMLCFAYKWYNEKTTHIKALPDYKGYKKDRVNDKALVEDLWKLFDEAEVIVAHNGRQFDIKKSNARFIKHGLKPPSPYKIVDTRDIARKHFKFDSNKLDDLGDYLSIGRKINTGGFELWLGCEANDPKAWKKMKDYNIQDVILLEKVYRAMLPYMDTHPNRALMDGNKRACPNCGSTKIQSRGVAISRVSVFNQWHCQSCGSWSRSPMMKDKAKEYPQVR